MTDKPITQMTNEELLAEVEALRARRSQARERKAVAQTSTVNGPRTRRSRVEDSDDFLASLGISLDDEPEAPQSVS